VTARQTVIDEGYASYDGTNAWWRETFVTGDVGMIVVLNEGDFNFKDNAFRQGQMDIER
jgi:hypothetical protein